MPANYIERVLQLAQQGFTVAAVRGVRHRLELEGVLTPSPARTATTRCASTTPSWRRCRRTAPGRSTGAPRRRRPQREGRPPKPRKTLQARELWDQIAYAAWSCADPGVQFDTTINEWHTCPADGRINASQPVLGIHVPRRHRLQSGVAEPAQVLRRRHRPLRRRLLPPRHAGSGR